MPKCKHCGSRITRFDKDICPVCGEKNPLEGVSSETIEITSNLDLSDAEINTFRPKTRFRTLLFFLGLGFSGAPFFYLCYKIQGLVWLLVNLAILGGVGSILAFFTPLGILWGYLIILFGVYAFNILVGIILFFKHNLKDGRGEFLR